MYLLATFILKVSSDSLFIQPINMSTKYLCSVVSSSILRKFACVGMYVNDLFTGVSFYSISIRGVTEILGG